MSKPAKILKKRAALRIDQRLFQDAHKMMEEQKFGDFTAFIENLIRSEWARTRAAGNIVSIAPGRSAGSGGPEEINQMNDAPAPARNVKPRAHK